MSVMVELDTYIFEIDRFQNAGHIPSIIHPNHHHVLTIIISFLSR